MLSGDFLDQATDLLSFIRTPGGQGAFGGLQVVLCGDFMQLPPVQATNLAFQAEVWQQFLGYQRAEPIPLLRWVSNVQYFAHPCSV